MAEFTKSDLVSYTEFSRTKITGCIDSLLQKKVLVANSPRILRRSSFQVIQTE